MVLHRISPPGRRLLLIAGLSLVLLSAPLWVQATPLDETQYTYDRAEVETTATGIELTDRNDVPPRTPISDDIACAGRHYEMRACGFEAHLLDRGYVPTESYTNNPDINTPGPAPGYYDYVQIDEQLYDLHAQGNESAQREDGWYRVDLLLDPADPDEIIDYVSLDVTHSDVPDEVADTAREGETIARGEVDVPPHPIQTEDGTYYRVFVETWSDPAPMEGILRSVLTYGAPFLGTLLGIMVVRRIDIGYTDAYRREFERDR